MNNWDLIQHMINKMIARQLRKIKPQQTICSYRWKKNARNQPKEQRCKKVIRRAIRVMGEGYYC